MSVQSHRELSMNGIFAFTMPIWEIALRAILAYLALVFLVRVVPSRNAGHISPNDMLTAIVVGTLGATAITGDGSSVADLMLMSAIVLLLSYGVDRLEYRVPALRRLFRHRRTLLIDRGRLVRRNMRRELVTEEELLARLRKEGLEGAAGVRCAYMEADGEISVIVNDQRTA